MKPERLQQFKKLYFTSFGIDLSDADAMEELQSLLAIVRATFVPMSQSQLDRLQQRRRETGDLQDN
jgi:hypothetical protein